MDCTICKAKTKALISCAVTAQLICVFVFAYAKSRFSHNKAQMIWKRCKDLSFFVYVSIKLKHRGNANGPTCAVDPANHIHLPCMQKLAVDQ